MTYASYEVAVLAEAALGEGPTWDAEGRMADLDRHPRLPGPHVRPGLRPPHGDGDRAARGRGEAAGGGGLVANLRDGVGLYGPGGESTGASGASDGSGGPGGFRWLWREVVPGRRANDAAVAPDGALWAGTMRYDEAPGGGTLSRVGPDGTVETVLDDVAVSNGTGWSPDGRLMYYIDSPTRRIDVFDFDGQRAGRQARVGGRRGGRRFPRRSHRRRRRLRLGRPVGRRRGPPLHPGRQAGPCGGAAGAAPHRLRVRRRRPDRSVHHDGPYGAGGAASAHAARCWSSPARARACPSPRSPH